MCHLYHVSGLLQGHICLDLDKVLTLASFTYSYSNRICPFSASSPCWLLVYFQASSFS
uniref:Uncharacterized protein n=1 Tax=Arundo donax TaxID=35708 RepID=A0A0A9AVV7_ARUDO